MKDQCTQYYVVCEDGQFSNVIPTGAGKSCYNNRPMLTEECPAKVSDTKCSFEGIRCVNEHGDVMTDACSDHYAECTNENIIAIKSVPTGGKCFNSAFVLESACTFQDIQQSCAQEEKKS